MEKGMDFMSKAEDEKESVNSGETYADREAIDKLRDFGANHPLGTGHKERANQRLERI
jgi:hypothetical protein